MRYTLLGRSDLRVGEISFGCMSLGDDHDANAKLLHKAMDGGIKLFDTADLYQKGENEITVGKAFKGIRDKVIIATKVGNQWRSDGSGWDWNPSKKYILNAVEESLKRLQTDYIDLYQLHGGTIDDPIDETIEAFELLRQQGKIRYYGISSIRPNVIREYVRRSSIVSVMMQYSLLDRRPEEECLDLLHQHSIGVLTRGSLASGLLVNKQATSYLNYSSSDVSKIIDTVTQVAGRQRSNTQVALRFALHHKAITTAVVGIRSQEHLNQALDAVSDGRLSVKEISQLKGVLSANTYESHR